MAINRVESARCSRFHQFGLPTVGVSVYPNVTPHEIPGVVGGDPCDRRQLSLPESLLNPDDEAKSDATAEYLHTHEVHYQTHEVHVESLLQMKLGNFKQNDSYH